MIKQLTGRGYSQDCMFPAVNPTISGIEPDLWIPKLGRFQGTGQFKMHYVTEYVFCYIIYSGETLVRIDGKETLLKKGDLCFFFPNQLKTLIENENAPLKNVYIDLNGRFVEDILKRFNICPGNQVFSGHFDLLFEPLVAEMEAALKSDASDSFYMISSAWRFIEELRKSPVIQDTEGGGEPAEIAMAIISRNFRFQLSIEKLAERLGVSRATLFRQFRQRYGMSPKQCLDQLRLDQAIQLLIRSDIPISEIAYSCGYESLQHFSRMFRRKFFCSPTSYRDEFS